MDPTFWQQRWQENDIGFHLDEANPLLVNNIHRLNLSRGAHVFVPLCGKTLDIPWLLNQGFQVTGVELHEPAVKAVFDHLGLTPDIQIEGELKRYHNQQLTLYSGDFFKLEQQQLQSPDAIYDRGSLVALPDTMRAQYVQHLMGISQSAPQLVINYDYDQQQMTGPPFSINHTAMKRYYQQHYQLTLLDSQEQLFNREQTFSIQENVWHLEPIKAR